MTDRARPAHREHPDLQAEQRIEGRTIVAGVAHGSAVLEQPFCGDPRPGRVEADGVGSEVARLREAVAVVRQHLHEHVRRFHEPADEDLQSVVAAHLLILDDQIFFDGVAHRIRDEAATAERAVDDAFCAAADRLAATRDAYLRGRAEDLREVCQALRVALARGGRGFAPVDTGAGPSVYVSTNLRVSAVLRALRARATAFLTSSQAYSSHGAILLRAGGVPSIGGLDLSRVLDDGVLQDGTPMVVNATRGEVFLHPQQDRVDTNPLPLPELEMHPDPQQHEPLDAVSRDGVRVALWANIDNPVGAWRCFAERLRGLGLFRTEFLVLTRGSAPDEEDQVRVYRDLVQRLPSRPVVIRTFDIGADKVTNGLSDVGGTNPALGIRGLRRHLMRRPRELRTQLRAVLRATVGAEASVLLPMVTDVIDIQGAREHLRQVCDELSAEGVPYNRDIKLGAMVETPAAALRVKAILDVTDFVTIGTNDLSQYLSAADRNNAALSGYLKPETSGLFDLLRMVFTHARQIGREQDVLVGGELASDPAVAPRFVSLGCRALVVTPQAAAAVRGAIAAARVGEPDGATG